MSYILDALKKAEAERNTTASGPLLTRPASPAAFTPPAGQHRMWPWLALAVSICALIGVVWLWSAPSPATAPAVVAQAMPLTPAPQAEVEKRQAQPAPKTPADEQEIVQEEVPAKAKTARKAAIKKAATPATASAAASSTAKPESVSVAALHELPDALRQQIPPLKIGGYIYSANKADRSVLINNRLLREGDEAAPGVTLERMLPDGMVLSYKGTRYRMNY